MAQQWSEGGLRISMPPRITADVPRRWLHTSVARARRITILQLEEEVTAPVPAPRIANVESLRRAEIVEVPHAGGSS